MIQEENVYVGVYKVLMAGMALSTLFFIVGVVLSLAHPAVVPLNRDWIRAHYHWSVVLSGFAHGDPASYMLTGTLLLILTPVMRVIVSIYAFFIDKDYKYVVVTSIVLLVMVLTVILARFGLT